MKMVTMKTGKKGQMKEGNKMKYERNGQGGGGGGGGMEVVWVGVGVWVEGRVC